MKNSSSCLNQEALWRQANDRWDAADAAMAEAAAATATAEKLQQVRAAEELSMICVMC